MSPAYKVYMLEIFDLLFPTLCTGCRSYGVLLCHSCFKSIAAAQQFCIGCNKPSVDGKTCANCLSQNKLLPDQLICASNYKQELSSKIIGTLKYVGVKNLANTCAQIASDFLHKNFKPEDLFYLKQIFYITYVPMHKNKQIARGFNQAELIANSLGKMLSMPVLGLLQKTRKTKAQMGLNKEQRLSNIQGAFTAFDCADKNILLVDDVLTTGSTMRECAQELKKAGANKVYCLAIAKD